MRPALATAHLLLAAGCASSPPRQPFPPSGAPEVRAVRTAFSPHVDGWDADLPWQVAPETVLPLDGPAAPSSCRIRAVVVDETLFLLIQWKDPTEEKRPEDAPSRTQFGPRRRYALGADRREGDQLSILLPMAGTLSVDPWEGVEGRWDWWEWTAAISDRVGHASDRFWFVSRTRWPGAPESMEFDGNRNWRLGAEDEGTSIFPRPQEINAPGPATPPAARPTSGQGEPGRTGSGLWKSPGLSRRATPMTWTCRGHRRFSWDSR